MRFAPIGFRLAVNGKLLDSMSPLEDGGEWLKVPNPLHWDDPQEAIGYAWSESNIRDGQAVDVVSEDGTIQARVCVPWLLALQGQPDALGAPLELPEGSTL